MFCGNVVDDPACRELRGGPLVDRQAVQVVSYNVTGRVDISHEVEGVVFPIVLIRP